MELLVRRLWPIAEEVVDNVIIHGCTIGTLEIDGASHCYTLEDTVREHPGLDVSEWKQPGITAIQRGMYRVALTFSNRFQRILPLIQDVPGFAGVRFHGGNSEADTEGCVLVGMHKLDSRHISDCAPALNYLISELRNAEANNEETWLTIQ